MRRVLIALVLLALLPLPALAKVFLNGKSIDGLTNQTFEKVSSVRIDDQGNIHIQAPAYSVETVPVEVPAPAAPASPAAPGATVAPAAPPEAPAPMRITQRYWLVTEQSPPGKAEYDIDLFINATWVRKLRNGEEQVISDITRLLRPGKNSVRLVATKRVADARRSQSAEHVFRVVIGEGTEGGGRVMLEKPLIRFQRTAAQMDDVTEDFTLTTR
ncbi:MAG: hypothetical protein ABW123_01810 [Cystobacter sp.]